MQKQPESGTLGKGLGGGGDAPWLVGREEVQSALFCSKRLALASGHTVEVLDGYPRGWCPGTPLGAPGASIVYAPWSPLRANVHHFLNPVLPHFYTQGFSILSKALKSTNMILDLPEMGFHFTRIWAKGNLISCFFPLDFPKLTPPILDLGVTTIPVVPVSTSIHLTEGLSSPSVCLSAGLDVHGVFTENS